MFVTLADMRAGRLGESALDAQGYGGPSGYDIGTPLSAQDQAIATAQQGIYGSGGSGVMQTPTSYDAAVRRATPVVSSGGPAFPAFSLNLGTGLDVGGLAKLLAPRAQTPPLPMLAPVQAPVTGYFSVPIMVGIGLAGVLAAYLIIRK